MENQVYLCGWQVSAHGFRVWVIERPELSAEGATFEQADRALYLAIGLADGDGENVHEYDPAPPRRTGEPAHRHDLVTVSGEASARMASADDLFEGGLCADCYHPLGPRTATPLHLVSLQEGPRNAGWAVISRPAHKGPRLSFVSQAFRTLLTSEEDARFEWREIIGLPSSQQPLFELVDSRVSVPYVSPLNARPGWQCEVCGFAPPSFVLRPAIGQEHRNVAQSDLPTPLPGVFLTGKGPDWELCFTRERWHAMVRDLRAQGCKSSPVGVLVESQVERHPVRQSYQEMMAASAKRKAAKPPSPAI